MGKWKRTLAAARLVDEAASEAGAQRMQVGLAHGALEAEQEAVVVVSRVVNVVLVKDEGVGEGADLEQAVPVGGAARQS
jgi:hypothetical protein